MKALDRSYSIESMDFETDNIIANLNRADMSMNQDYLQSM